MGNVPAPLMAAMQSAVPTATQPVLSAPKENMPDLSSYIKGMPIGSGWTVRVIPSNQWKQPTMTANLGHPPYAYSDLGSRVTYLRGDVFHNLSPYVIQRILAHELGHLTLNTSDEGKANKWADDWMKQAGKK